MTDLECSKCGKSASYGDAMMIQVRTTCPKRRWPGDVNHDFQELNNE